MNTYIVGGSCPGTVSGCTFFNFYSAASRRAEVLEIGVFNRAALAINLKICRSASATGVTSASFQGENLDPYNPSGSSLARVGTAWTVAPASGAAQPLLYISHPNTAGYGTILSFPPDEPLVVAACAGIQVNPLGAAGSPMNWYFKWRE